MCPTGSSFRSARHDGTISRLESPSHPVSVDDERPARRSRSRRVRPRSTAISCCRSKLKASMCRSLDRAGRRRRRRDRRGVRAEAVVGDRRRATSLSRRSFRLDGGELDRGSSQRLAALPALDDSRLPLQHRRLRRQVRVALSRRAASYDEASLAEASAHVAALTADLGGTEILPALKFVLEQREDRVAAASDRRPHRRTR